MTNSTRSLSESKKVILPFEIKVCATCSYWDGPRKIDSEMGLAVVAENCAGKCLVQEIPLPGLLPVQNVGEEEGQCAWETLLTSPYTPPK